MYKKVIIAISFAFFISCADKAPTKDEVIITGNIKGLKKGKLYIQKVQDSTLVALDTIELNGSSNFESSIKLDSPEMLYLFVDRGQTNSMDNNLLFFAEPGKITIDTDLEYFFANAKITGSKNHELYKEYKDIIAKFNEQQLQLLQSKILGSKGNKNYNELDNQNKQDQLLKKKYLYSANFALTHADYEIAPYIALTDIYDMQPKFLEEIHSKMSPEVAKSKYGKKFSDYLKK
ncbi:hypothetical protein BWK63_00110 [Flavobacterium covae]|uniref:DUF4369 domain-containing protein n=1 Tax=Flavobacterium covae TaxID=2906076 RepID=A0ABW8PF38_9FLAO|nr:MULTISPECIES: DUF4369 domain-containing protein [Flavobacterium]OWP82462.1 hypothetical protein BWK63_00110 [Flavobacterium covae]POR22513.1 hypothetical protein BWK57_05940 [Flavobacterium columnare]